MLRRLQLQGRMAPGQCSLPRSARRQAHRLPASLQMQGRLARTQCSPLQAMSLLFPCSQVPMYLQCSARGQWPTLHQLQIQCRRPCCMRRLWAAVMLRECDESVAGLCRSPVRQKRRTSPVTCMWLRALRTTGRWPRRSSPARIPPDFEPPSHPPPPLAEGRLDWPEADAEAAHSDSPVSTPRPGAAPAVLTAIAWRTSVTTPVAAPVSSYSGRQMPYLELPALQAPALILQTGAQGSETLSRPTTGGVPGAPVAGDPDLLPPRSPRDPLGWRPLLASRRRMPASSSCTRSSISTPRRP